MGCFQSVCVFFYLWFQACVGDLTNIFMQFNETGNNKEIQNIAVPGDITSGTDESIQKFLSCTEMSTTTEPVQQQQVFRERSL